MNSLSLNVPSAPAKKLALPLPLDKIQSIRLASVLMESEYEICFPPAAQSVLEALALYFPISYRIGTEGAAPLKDVAIAHGPVPESRIGKLSRPLLYPQAVVSRCREKWLPERSIRFSFSGLMTPERRRTLQLWCRTCLEEEVAISGSGDTYVQQLVNRLSPGYRKKKALSAIGLHLFTSDRGRVFPVKVWDDAYYDTLGDSRFVLCPDGDFIWTYRFFEAALCGAIPIIEHTCPLYDGFEYYTMTDPADRFVWSPEIAERNFAQALKLLTVTGDELNRELARLAGESAESIQGSHPRVSVIIPVYNTAPFLSEALESVLTQTYTDYEIIVVNDGSPDSDVLEEVLKPYRDRITYIVQENRGSSGARNSALKVARGHYVAMLDSDDLWHPEYLASQVEVLESDATLDVVYPDAVRFTVAGVGSTRYSESSSVGGEITFLRVLARKCQIYGEVTARRETLLRVGMYDEELRSGEDYELWLRILKAGGRIAYNNRVLAYYRVREGSHTSNAPALVANVLEILDKIQRTMVLTAEEHATVNQQRLDVTAVLSLSEGKQAIIEGDTTTAIRKLRVAADYTNSWKLRGVILSLRVAPGALVRFYRLREWWEKRRAGVPSSVIMNR